MKEPEKSWKAYALEEMRRANAAEDRIRRLPQHMARLVIAARIVAFEDKGPQAIRELGQASEAFAELVPWEDQPQPA